MKMLTEACEREFPQNYYDAPLFLADLYAYVGHKTGNRECVEKGVEAFIEGFPETQNPSCYVSGSHHWSQQSAMTLRSGHLLQCVTWRSKP